MVSFLWASFEARNCATRMSALTGVGGSMLLIIVSKANGAPLTKSVL